MGPRVACRRLGWWRAGGLDLDGDARRSRWDAAYEIDRRFGLKERVSTACGLTDDERATPAGQAVVDDACQQILKVRVADGFAMAPPRGKLWPVPLAALAMLSTLWIKDTAREPVASAAPLAASTQVKNSAQSLEKRMAEKRAEARAKGLDEAGDLLTKIEQGTRKIAETEKADPKKALLELNDLSKDLQKRRDQLLAGDMLQKQLNQLKGLDGGPADKFAQDMKNGNFRQAAEELQKLQDKIANGQLDPQEKEKLAEQLEHMQQNLQKAADAHDQARQDLERQIAQQRQSGNAKEAERLQQQLDKVEQQAAQAEQMRQMSNKLCEAGKCLKAGDGKACNEQLTSLKSDLQDAQKEMDELAMCEETLEQISQAKSSMSCKQCEGQGCKECQGEARGKSPQIPGPPGKGHRDGVPQNEQITAKLYDTKVQQQVRPGAALVEGQAEGANRKGEVREEIKAQFESSRHEADDPLTSQRLPRDYREHAKKYFESLREGTK